MEIYGRHITDITCILSFRPICNVQNYWGSEICPLSGILKTRTELRLTHSETPIFTHLRTETDTVSKMLCFLVFFLIRMMDKVQNPSNSDCHKPLSEPFRLNLSCIL
jgi:hypothetical protein